MNRLKTDLYGGFPLELDDLRWALTGIERALKGLVDGTGTGSFILAGCEVTPGGLTSTLAPGFVAFAGEVYEFAGGTFPTAALDDMALVPEHTWDPTGTETFEDLTVQQTYEKRVAVLDFAPSLPTPGVRLTGPKLGDQLWDVLSVVMPAWNVIGAAGQPAYINGWAGSVVDPPRYRREPGGLCRFQGTLVGSAATLDEPFVIAAGFRPVTTVYRDVMASGGLTPSNDKQIRIPASGAVKLIGASATFGNYDLGNMTPWEIAN